MQRLELIAQTMSQNVFEKVTMAPPDPILGTAVAYKEDKDANKVNLGIGAYRNDDGVPYVFKVVKKVEAEIVADKKLDKEYLPIEGLAAFITGSQKLIFGENSSALKEDKVGSLQTISGTGSLRIGFEFLAKYNPRTVYISNPTWLNHKNILSKAGLKFVEYTYSNPKTISADISGMIASLEKAEPGSIVLLHACAHNPTGVDPTQEDWKKIAQVMLKNNLFPYFDSAYQGFASGDIEYDAWAIRYFVSLGFQMLVSQSYAKNMGLYGERIGALHIVTANTETKNKVLSQVKDLVRASYSSPPLHGARIAERILNDKANLQAWKDELKAVADRTIVMRKTLRKALEDLKTPGNTNIIQVNGTILLIRLVCSRTLG